MNSDISKIESIQKVQKTKLQKKLTYNLGSTYVHINLWSTISQNSSKIQITGKDLTCYSNNALVAL
jgi:hypothetical protein